MQITLRDAVESQMALNWATTQNPGSRESFRIGRLLRPVLRALSEETALLEATRLEIVKRLGTKVEGQKDEYEFAEGKRLEFEREYQALLKEAITLEVKPIMFCEIEQLPWTVGLLSPLEWLFIDDRAEMKAPAAGVGTSAVNGNGHEPEPAAVR